MRRGPGIMGADASEGGKKGYPDAQTLTSTSTSSHGGDMMQSILHLSVLSVLGLTLLVTGCATHFDKGKTAYQERRYLEAKTEFIQALSESKVPLDEVHRYLASVYFTEGNHPEALEHALTSYKLKPSKQMRFLFREILEGYLRQSIAEGRYTAIRDILTGVERQCDLCLDELHVEVLEAQIEALIDEGNFDQALALLPELPEAMAAPKRRIILIAAVKRTFKEGKVDQSLAWYAQYKELEPTQTQDDDLLAISIQLTTYAVENRMTELQRRNDYLSAAELYRATEGWTKNRYLEILVAGLKKNLLFANTQAKELLRHLFLTEPEYSQTLFDRDFLAQYSVQLFQLLLGLCDEFLSVRFEPEEVVGLAETKREMCPTLLDLAGRLAVSAEDVAQVEERRCRVLVFDLLEELEDQSEDAVVTTTVERFGEEHPRCVEEDRGPLSYYTALALFRLGGHTGCVARLEPLAARLPAEAPFRALVDSLLSRSLIALADRELVLGSSFQAFVNLSRALTYLHDANERLALAGRLEKLLGEILKRFFDRFQDLTAREIVAQIDAIHSLDPGQAYFKIHRGTSYQVGETAGNLTLAEDFPFGTVRLLPNGPNTDSSADRGIEVKAPDYCRVAAEDEVFRVYCAPAKPREKRTSCVLTFHSAGEDGTAHVSKVVCAFEKPAKPTLLDIVNDYFTLRHLDFRLRGEWAAQDGALRELFSREYNTLYARMAELYPRETRYRTLALLMKAKLDETPLP